MKGQSNKVSDALSCWFKYRTDDKCNEDDFVKADIHLDPEGDDLPQACLQECRTIQIAAIA